MIFEDPRPLDLASAARAEAAAFALPPDWQRGRTPCTGLAIDEPYSPDIDDVVGAEPPRADGSSVLHVSVADVGNFIPPDSAMTYRAMQLLRTRYDGERVAEPMLPAEISENVLSLQHGVPRPVLTASIAIGPHGEYGLPAITPGIIRAKRITPDEVDELFHTGEASPELRHLGRVARMLYAARHGGRAVDNFAPEEDEEGGDMPGRAYGGLARFIVQECMVAANAAIARFMQANSIPALYRNHEPPNDLRARAEAAADSTERMRLLGSVLASYAIEPRGHAGLNLGVYMHATSPLRRIADLVNQANLSAFLNGRPFPYAVDLLQEIASRDYARAVAESRTRGVPGSMAPKRQCGHLLERINSGEATPGELEWAAFDAIGSPEEVASLRRAAALYVAEHPELASAILHIAESRKHVRTRGRKGNNNPAIFVDRHGRTYPLARSERAGRAAAAARVLGQLCGVEAEAINDALPKPGRQSNDYDLLCAYAHKSGSSLQVRYVENEDGTVTARMSVARSGQKHTVSVTAKNKKTALRQACARMIEHHDLRRNPPPAAATNPANHLYARLHSAGLRLPEYTIVQAGPGEPYVCTVSAEDAGGASHQASASAPSKKGARQAAAAALLAALDSQADSGTGTGEA